MAPPIVSGAEPFPINCVGLVVRFDYHRKGGKVTREAGEVIAQKWLGFTERGNIPEYELTILGKSGKTVTARLTDDYVREIE